MEQLTVRAGAGHRRAAADVIVVGGGVAGLAAAHQLSESGLQVLVVEAGPVVGGRLTTRELDGFRMDTGNRFLFGSCPELARVPALEKLTLRPFAPGALIHADGRRHRTGETAPNARGALSTARELTRSPRLPRQWARDPAAGGLAPLGTTYDRARLNAALARLAETGTERLLARPEFTAAEALATGGLPRRTLDRFVRPLLRALLGDPALGTSSRVADLTLQAYARGPLCQPEGGAEALPRLLAEALPPDSVLTGVRVTSVSTTTVRTQSHGPLGCRAVLVATGAAEAARLLPGLRRPAFHPLTVLHHAAPPLPATDLLLIDADRCGPVSHTAVVSAVDPTRAPAGRSLVSSTVLGAPPDEPDARVRRQLSALYGTSASGWELLDVHHDPEAVTAMPPPHDLRRPVRLLAGLYVCGDHRDTGGVQGALRSGRRAAAALLHDLGLSGAPAPRVPAVA